MSIRRLILALVPLPMVLSCDGSDEEPTSGCPDEGTGSIVVEIDGLPSGVDADVTLEGPDGPELVTEETTFDDLGGGKYSVAAERVTDADPIVRTVFDATVETETLCLQDGKSETVTVSYRAIPTSGKLWTTNANGDHALAAFGSALLGDSGDPAATVTVDGPTGKDVAFDRDGNLWSIGPTTADPHLVRFAAETLGASGEKEPDRSLVFADHGCSPAVHAIAFDPSGNLWASVCIGEVFRVDAPALESDGELSGLVTISNVTDNGNLAFDASGNLWIITEANVARYDAERLEASDDGPADSVLTVTDPESMNPLAATDLAFDAAGNLWATDFAGNLVFQIAEADLSGTGESTVAASARITIGVTALLDRPAFDESGGLFIGLGGGGVGRLSPAQLLVDTSAGAPTDPEVVLTSADFGSVGRVAFFPAAGDLPLFHALP